MDKTKEFFYWFVFHEDMILVQKKTDNTFDIPLQKECPLSGIAAEMELIPYKGYGCKAVRLSARETPSEGAQWVTLRHSFELLPRALYQHAGKASELLYWNAHSRYCGTCGALMTLHTPISKRCSACGREVWPELATAIIVLVSRGDEVLLVQSKNFKGDYLGLVAGFVETGESLEECVHREVGEETGIAIKNIRYVASQPWPYPCGLMVGFFAEYDGGTLKLQRSELNKGGWYHRHALPEIPGRVSLARRLLDKWVNETES